jgi:hypothetical protein
MIKNFFVAVFQVVGLIFLGGILAIGYFKYTGSSLNWKRKK